MQKFRKLCFILAAIFTLSAPFSSCVYEEVDSSLSNSSFSQESSFETSFEREESVSEEESSSDSESVDDSSSEGIIDYSEMWAIVDTLYELAPGESLPEPSYTLTGIVTATEYVNGRRNITFTVVGRENKPIYCFDIIGANSSSVKKGDTITVSGSLKNYKGEYFEFDKNCTLDDWISASGDTGSGGNTDNNGNDTVIQPTTPAKSNEEARIRSQSYQISGSLVVPDQAPVLAENRPKSGEKFIRNSEIKFSEDGNAYTVVDVNGNDAFTVFRDGAYITLEEVAAFVYAFGTYPANYTTSKNTKPTSSGWGKYLRVNHSSFSGDTSSYPYEPILPNISGCGGNLRYYEMDIGTTGTDCDPSYECTLYNNGSTITRGAARIVYGKTDLNKNGVYEINEHHLFYTYNHYNDFQEYLNYAGGWGEMFGNITGGGTISSKTDYNPTEYISISLEPLPALLVLATTPISECGFPF